MKPIMSLIKLIALLAIFYSNYSIANCSYTYTYDSSLWLDNNDGTITHIPTGLMWKQCSEGQSENSNCSGTPSNLLWNEALQLPENLSVSGGFAGYNDWRLPNIKELHTLIDFSCSGPSINSYIFPNTSTSFYWSSTVSNIDPISSWSIMFSTGTNHSDSRGLRRLVRLVRGGN
jgi:hypothetical protein